MVFGSGEFPMSNELDKQLASLIEGAKQAGQDAVAFIQQHAPDLAEQVVRWHFWNGLITSVAALCACAALAYFARMGYLANKKDDYSGGDMVMMVCAMCAAFSFCVSVGFGAQAVKATVAPKVVLIETLADVVSRK
jgi:hypothetical protein